LEISDSSREIEVVAPPNSLSLVVACRLEAQPQLSMPFDHVHRDEEATVEVGGIRGDRIDFRARVDPPNESGTRAARRVAADDDSVRVSGR
jgi:hypothetical protein